MHRIPISISVLILIAWIATSAFLFSSQQLALTKTQLVEYLIQLAAVSGALISATFVVWSYIQTNKAFILSQKPALLLFVENLKLPQSQENSEIKHLTQVMYKNTTGNSFEDLTIHLALTIKNRTVDLSDLFTPRMYMAGYDQRQRHFVTVKEIGSRGLDFEEMTQSGNAAMLSLSYTFTFLGRPETVRVQEYVWELDKQLWSVR